MSTNRVLVYVAMSLDGYIAGPDDDLSWLPSPGAGVQSDPGSLGFEEFLEGVGALLMGRRTYDVVRGFGGPWIYGERPVLVASTRALDADPPAQVRQVEGTLAELVAHAKQAAGDKDVYLDGGDLIRQAAKVGLIDELTITLVPVALGRGVSLFGGLEQRLPLEIVSTHRYAGELLQLRLVPKGLA